MTGNETLRLEQVRATNAEAEEAYLQGRLHLASYGPDSAQRALDAFNRAVALDPGYGAAHAGAAVAYIRLGDSGVISLADARQSALRPTSGRPSTAVRTAPSFMARSPRPSFSTTGIGMARKKNTAVSRAESERRLPANLFRSAAGRSRQIGRSDQDFGRDDAPRPAVSAGASPARHGPLLQEGLRRCTRGGRFGDRTGARRRRRLHPGVTRGRGSGPQSRRLGNDRARRRTVGGYRSKPSRHGHSGAGVRRARDVAFAAANELLAEATKGTVRLRQRDRAYMELALGGPMPLFDRFAPRWMNAIRRCSGSRWIRAPIERKRSSFPGDRPQAEHRLAELTSRSTP